jgi:Spy/CpxP family protein refolding chaperone
MNRTRSLVIGSLLMFAPAVMAQQSARMDAPANGTAQSGDLPKVEEQLKVLAQKLDLTVDQQPKVKAVLMELHAATQKVVMDQTLSDEQRLDKVRPLRMKADKQLREFLSDDQKKKLDQYLAGPHSEMHGNLHGTPPPATGKPQS